MEYNEIVKLREYEGVKLNQLFGFDQSVKRNQLFGIDQSVSSKYNKNRFGNYDGSNYKYTLIVQTDALWGSEPLKFFFLKNGKHYYMHHKYV